MNELLLNPLYYLDNFQSALDWIDARYSDVLTSEEHAFITSFRRLPQPARALFVRMVMRKGTLFRSGQLRYAEIGRADAAIAPLQAVGWLERDPVVSLDEIFDLLTKPELARVFGWSRTQQAGRKSELLATQRAADGEPGPFSAWCAGLGDDACRLLVRPLCDRLRLMYFGNLRQDWAEFVLSDLGVFRYEPVEISPASRGFRSRKDIDDYLALHACRQAIAAGSAPGDVLRTFPSAAFANDWLESRRQRQLFSLGQALERLQDWGGAYEAFAQCRFPGARARAVRVLEKDHQFDAAQALLALAQEAPESEAERQQLQRIAPRLARKLGLTAPGRPPRAVLERLELALPRPIDRSVEHLARAALQQADAPVYYVENTLINSLVGLLCWSAIFSAIPGAFFHPFQRAPADLYSPDFFRRRTAEFAACLAELEDDRYCTTIRQNFLAKRGTESPFVAWEAVDETLLELALACIPAAHLRKWCERILQDVGANRSGLPDLIQFWPAERRYRMIEVKGPGDRLQDNQLRWIDYCAANEMPVAVCFVQWEAPI